MAVVFALRKSNVVPKAKIFTYIVLVSFQYWRPKKLRYCACEIELDESHSFILDSGFAIWMSIDMTIFGPRLN